MPCTRPDWAREEMAWAGRRAASLYAQALIGEGRYQEAVDLLEPSHPKGQDALTLASAYLGLGQDDRARDLLEALVRVRRLWRPEGDSDTQETRREARRVLGELLVRREPQNPRGYLLLAVHFLQCRDRTQARTWAEKGLAVAPNHANVWDRANPKKARPFDAESELIYFYTRTRQWEKAEPLLRARAERTPSVFNFEALAQCYKELGWTEEAAQWRERAEKRRAGKGKG